MGVSCGQSAFVRQATHCPSGEHSLSVACDAQSLSAKHCTHDDDVVSHKGASPWHCALEVHPGRHVKSCGLQMGCAVPQSVLSRHSTQRPSATWQRGAAAGQLVFVSHSTHDPVAASQIAAPPAHGVVASHSTQTPGLEVVSQTGAFFGQSPFAAQPA